MHLYKSLIVAHVRTNFVLVVLQININFDFSYFVSTYDHQIRTGFQQLETVIQRIAIGLEYQVGHSIYNTSKYSSNIPYGTYFLHRPRILRGFRNKISYLNLLLPQNIFLLKMVALTPNSTTRFDYQNNRIHKYLPSVTKIAARV